MIHLRTMLRPWFLLLSACFLPAAFSLLPSAFCFLPSARGFDKVIDSPMYTAPALPVVSEVMVFPEEAKDLWLRALERPEANLRCQAAEAVALAHRRGMKGLESTISPLLKALARPDEQSAVRLAIAQALIALEAREAAPQLWQQAQLGSSDLRGLVEPVLARWDYRPIRAVWLERLRDSATTEAKLALAIRGLAAVREEEAATRLREMTAADLLPPSLRLEAARALGALRDGGLEPDAERLAADSSPRGIPARLQAAALLSRHGSTEAIGLLQRLANDPEPAVAIIAGTRLLEIDPGLLIPTVERLLASPDANLRSLGVQVLYRRPSEAHVHLLTDRLDDPHSDVRVQARRHLEELAKKDLRDRVIAEGTRMLATQQWRGLEQATILLTLLDHKPAAPRLVELLPFNRPEVGITAAWGLRRMAVPETLPGVVKYVQVGLSRPVVPGHVPDPRDIASLMMDHQLSQLNQLLGKQKYGPADEVLRRFIPRRADNSWPESRAAAIWALGLIHEGTTQEALASAAEQRLNDIATMPPEDPQVRCMAAITLARLRAKQALPSLRKICPKFEPSEDPVMTACGWAIEQLTGETMPPPQPIFKMQRDWFLAPHK